MSASKSKKERRAEAALGLSEKEKQAQTAAKKAKQKTVIYTIIGIVVALCVAALLFWDSGVIQKHSTAVTIGDHQYSVADVDYYYNSTLSSYSSYAELYGLDLDQPLDEQEVYEGYTWDQMLKDSAIDSLTSVAMLVDAANAEGFTLSQDGSNEVKQALINIESYATIYGTSEEYFLQANYGKYMTVEDFERILTDYQLATEYVQHKVDSMEASEEDIQAFYEENSVELDTIDYNCYLVSFDTTEKDADGNTVDLDEATIEANRKKAEAQAQEILDALVAGDADKAAELAETYGTTDDSNMSGTSIAYSGFADWMSDRSHGAGSYDLVENVNSSTEAVIGYFAIYVNSRELDDYKGANIRALKISAGTDDDGNYDMDECKQRAEQILATFEETEKDSEAFAQTYTNASGDSNYEGGLRENVSKTAFNDEMTQWIFASSRKQGDYKLFEDADNNCYYLVYFEGLTELPYWKNVCIDNVQQEMYYDWQEEALANYPATNGFGMRFVG